MVRCMDLTSRVMILFISWALPESGLAVSPHGHSVNDEVPAVEMPFTAPFRKNSAGDMLEIPRGSATQPLSPQGTVEFNFRCHRDSTVAFLGRFGHRASTDADSLYIGVDDSALEVWHIGHHGNHGGTGSRASPEFSVLAGEHQLFLHVREDGMLLDRLWFRSIQGIGDCQFQRIHESVTRISVVIGSAQEPFRKRPDFVEFPAGSLSRGSERGSLEFEISCEAASEVSFQLEAITPDGHSDSFFIVNSEGELRPWHLGISSSWKWGWLSEALTVPAGSFRLQLRGREDGDDIKVRTLKFAKGHSEGNCRFHAPRNWGWTFLAGGSTSPPLFWGPIKNPYALWNVGAASVTAFPPFRKTPEGWVEFPTEGDATVGSVEFDLTCSEIERVAFSMNGLEGVNPGATIFIQVDSGPLQEWTLHGLSPFFDLARGNHRVALTGRPLVAVTMKDIQLRGHPRTLPSYAPVLGWCQFKEYPIEKVGDTLSTNICGALSKNACETLSEESKSLHGVGCVWNDGDTNFPFSRCDVRWTPETSSFGCGLAKSLEDCRSSDETAPAGVTCVWSGDLCFAFNEFTTLIPHTQELWKCEYKDPAVCEPNVAVQLAGGSQVDPRANVAFEWNFKRADLVRNLLIDPLESLPFPPIVGGLLGGLINLGFLWKNSGDEQQLCAGLSSLERSECLFRYIAEYLKTYVEEVLRRIRYEELQRAIDTAGIQLERLTRIIEPLGPLENLTRDDICCEDQYGQPNNSRLQLDNWFLTHAEIMEETLIRDFMFSGGVFAPMQATYTAIYASATFQVMASQILFDPSYNTSGQVNNLVAQIDDVTEFVVRQMEAAKWHRLRDIAVDPEFDIRSNTYWLDMKDNYNQCPWESNVMVLQNHRRRGYSYGPNSRIHHQAWEAARKCLKLRKRWVAWKEDVLWREALRPHLEMWQYLKRAAMGWPVQPRSSPKRRLGSAVYV